MHINARPRQTGGGLTSFIVGLLIATAVIAGILYFLNHSKSDFKNPVINNTQPSTPEILTPSTSSMPDMPSPVIQTSPAASQPTEVVTPSASEAEKINTDVINYPNHPTNNLDIPKTTPKQNSVKSNKSNNQSNNQPVTPEQILNNGSIEKAQQEVQKLHTKQNKNNVYLQIGSFNNHTEADAQRAKLVMLGIDSNIVSVKVSGTTKYRVLTNSLNQQQANQIRETLQQHNVDSLTKKNP